jgi:hypothetical protein
MKVYIKEWANKTATLLTENGEVVWTFSSVSEARQACQDWRSITCIGGGDCHENPGEAVSWCLA